MLLSHGQFLEEGFGSSWSEPETSRARKSGRADHDTKISSSSDRVSDVTGQGMLGPPANKKWMEKWRKDLKIAGVCDQRLLYLTTSLIDIRRGNFTG